jgi:hypothetical protein
MSAPGDEPVTGQPVRLLTVEGLNYLTTALLYATAQRMGPEFMSEVVKMAEHLRYEREAAISFITDE